MHQPCISFISFEMVPFHAELSGGIRAPVRSNTGATVLFFCNRTFCPQFEWQSSCTGRRLPLGGSERRLRSSEKKAKLKRCAGPKCTCWLPTGMATASNQSVYGGSQHACAAGNGCTGPKGRQSVKEGNEQAAARSALQPVLIRSRNSGPSQQHGCVSHTTQQPG